MIRSHEIVPDLGTSPNQVWRLVDKALSAFGVTGRRPDRATILEQGIANELTSLDIVIQRLQGLERSAEVELEVALLFSVRERLKFLQECAGTLAAVVASEPPEMPLT